MNILVTGGAGFIGSNFLNTFVVRYPSYRFVNVDKLTYAANLSNLANIQDCANYVLERVDIADLDALRSVFVRHRPDVVVHFAAESHVDRSIAGPRAFVRTNIEGTFNLLEVCREQWDGGRGLFVHVSTDEVYGSVAEGFLSETSRYDPSSPYSASKAASDHLVRAYARTYGLPVKITNSSNNYGPRQFPEKLIPLMILNALEQKPLTVYGRGENVRDWLYVDDHCEAIWAVIEKGGLSETYNIAASQAMRNIDVVRAICAVISDETGASRQALEALITFVKDRPGHDYRYAIDASKIRSECGWAPRETFETGLRKTVRWYLENADWVQHVRTAEYRRWLDQNYSSR